MRAKDFTFKKTKTVKTVTEFNGLSLDLTVDDAKALERSLADTQWSPLTQPIYLALCEFIGKNLGKASP